MTMTEERDEQRSLEWKRLLSELHHRLNNDLQMITSVISIQVSRITDRQIAAALRAAQNRVRAIVGALGRHTTPDLATVHFGNYLDDLVRELASEFSISDRVEIEVMTADMALDVDRAISLALIANELTANALEHAFPADARGKMCVTLSYAKAALDGAPGASCGELTVSDDGRALPANWNYQTAQSTGFHLVRALTAQLRAQISVEERPRGKTFRIVFPLGGGEAPD